MLDEGTGTLSAIDVAARDAIRAGAGFSGLIPPMSAQPVELDKSDAPLTIERVRFYRNETTAVGYPGAVWFGVS